MGSTVARDSRRTSATVTAQEIDDAIGRGQQHLLSLQRADGSWAGTCLAGISQHYVAVCERFLGCLSPSDAQEAGRFLVSQQRADGGYTRFPGGTESDREGTCMAYAALRACGRTHDDAAVRGAWRFIERAGGIADVELLTRIVLAIAGAFPAEKLPPLPLAHKWFAGAERLLIRRVACWSTFAANLVPGLVRGLRNRGRGRAGGRLAKLEEQRVIEYLTSHQNPNGSWFGMTFLTALGAVCLHVLGVPVADDRIQRALAWIGEMKRYAPEGLDYLPWRTEIWDTAWALRALVNSGLCAEHPRVQAASHYLVAQQGRLPMPEDWQNPAAGTPRTGGWSWVAGGDLHADCDDTSFVLVALAAYAQRRTDPPVEASLDAGVAFVLGMQNRDGGWPTWTRGHPSKKPGPLRLGTFAELHGDPSWEDITARVLEALGGRGHKKGRPEIDRALGFLCAQRDANGAWWGRWAVNYLIATASALSGFAAVGEDLQAEHVRRAAGWLLARQNPDGGWGETTASYADPAQAGKGESRPGQTAIVLSALLDAGEGPSRAAMRAARFLLDCQTRDGTWIDVDVQCTMFPSRKLYYIHEYVPKCRSIEALAKLRTVLRDEKVDL